jgi:3-oxoacyl-[acyl-carrier protein] reductase
VRLEGQVVYLTGGDGPLGAGLAAALAGAGATVVDVEPAFSADPSGRPRPDAVVHALLDPVGLAPTELADVDDARFEAVWERGMRAAISCCQSAFRAFMGAGGRIVFVLPTVAMSGASGLAALCALAEGERLLAKSAARQWGAAGITVNCLAVGGAGFEGDAISLAPAALASVDVGAALVGLLAAEFGSVTGATICADGGIWMSP